MDIYKRDESNIGATLSYDKANRHLHFNCCEHPQDISSCHSGLKKGYLASPLKIFIGLTRKCNLNCPMCFSRRTQNAEQPLPMEIILNLIQQCYEMKVFEIRLTGGEPTMHPDFLKISEAIADGGMSISVNTNGAYSDTQRSQLMQSPIDLFSVSIDGSKDIHDKLRGRGVFDKAVSTLYAVKDAGKKGRINTMIFNDNINRIEEMIALAESVGFPIRFCPIRPIGSPGSKSFSNQHILTNEQWKEIKSQLQLLRQSSSVEILFFSNAELEDFERCEGVSAGINNARCASWITQMGIDPEGYVYAGGCIDDVSKDISVGHLREHTLATLWNRVLSDVKKRLLPSFKNCQSCDIEKLLPAWIQKIVCDCPDFIFPL